MIVSRVAFLAVAAALAATSALVACSPTLTPIQGTGGAASSSGTTNCIANQCTTSSSNGGASSSTSTSVTASGTTSSSTTSSATTTSSTTTTSSSSTTSSTGSGLVCTDNSEPNDTIQTAFALNDPGTAVDMCNKFAVVGTDSVLSGMSDVDFFTGYMTRNLSCTLSTILDIYYKGGTNDPPIGSRVCWYLQDQGGVHLVTACQQSQPPFILPEGYSGCCGSVTPFATAGISLPEVVDFSTLSPDPIQFLVKVFHDDQELCYPYHFEVDF